MHIYAVQSFFKEVAASHDIPTELPDVLEESLDTEFPDALEEPLETELFGSQVDWECAESHHIQGGSVFGNPF